MASGRLWTPEEIGHLKRRYPVVGPRKVADELRRTLSAVHKKAYSLGLQAHGRHDADRKPIGSIYANSGLPWKPADDDFLRRSYRALGASVCAKQLHRNANAVYVRASKLSLQSQGTQREALWKQRGDKILLGIVRTVAQELGVSVFAVVRRIGVLYSEGRITENEQERPQP